MLLPQFQSGGKTQIPMPEKGDYIGLYNETLASGAMADPAVEEVVTAFSKIVISLSESVNAKNAKLYNSEITPNEVNETIYSSTTSLVSQGICDSGGGNGSLTTCP